MTKETLVPPFYQSVQFPAPSDPALKTKVLSYISHRSAVHCFLDSNQHSQDTLHLYDWIAACCPVKALKVDPSDLNVNIQFLLKEFINPGAWYFSVLGYDLKNNLETLNSRNPDDLKTPELVCFEAEEVLTLQSGQITIYSKNDPAALWDKICRYQMNDDKDRELKIVPQPQISKEHYKTQIDKVRKHILDGDIYELNFCQSFSAGYDPIDTIALFKKMCTKTKAPFAAYFQYNEFLLMSSSPERFLQKINSTLISQPIKGTISRDSDPEMDLLRMKELKESEKNRAENVMIVDLVRNDLSRSCKPGTVKVNELFGIYSFEKVHHMISTVSGELKEDFHWVDALFHCFPMGSMTGAPKVKSMQLIEELESFKRGWFSGAVGYIDPDCNFDFSVVIRSIIFNEKKKLMMLAVGGAIVHDSEAEQEYEESLLKAKSLFELLNNKEGL